MRERPIGVFDSGIGGLTVMRALMARLPRESFIYLGDTARLPYGSKSPETVARYAVQCAQALRARDIKLLVVACNTASLSLPTMIAALAPMPVLGVIEPGAQAAVAAAPEGRIAVIATEGTVKGGAYVRAIHARAPQAQVVQKACPLFVALAEEGMTDGPIAELVTRNYLDALFAASHERPECLVLGCTHFPALHDVIARVAGPQTILVDSARTTAEAVARELAARGIAHEGAAHRPRFLATDSPERFARVGEIFLGAAIDPQAVEQVDLQTIGHAPHISAG
jgi:glutamate racemase